MKTSRKHRKRARHDGITLIELLVVIFIMLLITAIAIPMMIPSLEGRRLRETSRVITSHFQGARTRAIQTGRSFGVMIEPQAGLTDAGITLSYMAEAEPWSGDTVNSRVRVIGHPALFNGRYYGQIPSNGFVNDSTGQLDPNETGWMGLIRPGDQIQFGGGRWFQITSGEPYTDTNGDGNWDTGEPFLDLSNDMPTPVYNGPVLVKGTINALPWTLTPVVNTVPPTMVPTTGGASGLSLDVNMDGVWDPGDPMAMPVPIPPDQWARLRFTVRRQPTKTAAHPLQLPNAMVVDLAFSGTNGLPSMNGLGPITVLFTPTGALSSVYFYQNNLARVMNPNGPLFLLVGKVDKIGNTAAGERNFEDQTNLWVTIHPQTGLITGTEVGPDLDSDGTTTLTESRVFAHHGLALGGR